MYKVIDMETMVLKNDSNSAQIIRGEKIRKSRLVTVPIDTVYDDLVWSVIGTIKPKMVKSNKTKKEDD